MRSGHVPSAEIRGRHPAASLIHRQIFFGLLKRYKRIMSVPLFSPRTAICWWLAAASPTMLFAQNPTPLSSEYAIAGTPIGDQIRPQAAVSSTGGFLVWQDNSVKTLGPRIQVLRLDGSLSGFGLPFSASSAVSSKTAGDQEKPQVALLANGGAVVVWQGGRAG